jgi:transposase
VTGGFIDMQIHSIGIDLGKTTFHLVALGAAGKVLTKKKFTQKQLLGHTANLQTSLIGLEACSGAHFLGRALRKQGHDVRLIAAQFVKPFVKSNKNDFLDAEAIAEALAGRTCALCRSRPTTSSICRRFIECVTG